MMKCEKCGGRMIVKDSAADEYVKHRRRQCDNCGRVMYTTEQENKYAEYDLKRIRNGQREEIKRRQQHEKG